MKKVRDLPNFKVQVPPVEQVLKPSEVPLVKNAILSNIYKKMNRPDINMRIKLLIDFYCNGNVNQFVKNLSGISQQKLNRLFNIDIRTKKYPLATTDVIVAIVEMYVEINPEWLLLGKGSMFRENLLALSIGEEQNHTYMGDYLIEQQGDRLRVSLVLGKSRCIAVIPSTGNTVIIQPAENGSSQF